MNVVYGLAFVGLGVMFAVFMLGSLIGKYGQELRWRGAFLNAVMAAACGRGAFVLLASFDPQ